MLPPVRPASRSFVLAAARLRALHPDPLLTDGDRPLPRKDTMNDNHVDSGPRPHREVFSTAWRGRASLNAE
jgi:hypothetical protein